MNETWPLVLGSRGMATTQGQIKIESGPNVLILGESALLVDFAFRCTRTIPMPMEKLLHARPLRHQLLVRVQICKRNVSKMSAYNAL